MKGFFGSLFGNGQKPRKNEERAKAVGRTAPEHNEFELYKKGDVIGGKYEVRGKLGKGGFGIVYLVQDRDTDEVCALKTFRDEFLANLAAREAFKKEALLWVNLEWHPFILAARWVHEMSGRLFVAMEYIVHDAEGRVNLTDHLARADGGLDINQTLKWAIQFCLGMEHARVQGVQCHRDIKPDNILITQDGTLKISDFGLATAAEVVWRGASDHSGSVVTGGEHGNFGLSLIQSEGKRICGTPGYIAPEVYRGEGANIQSDIFSFGLVLWQMAAGSRMPPFMVRLRGNMDIFLREIYEQQMSGRVQKTNGHLGSVIERCLRPKPSERYENFDELRKALQLIWEHRTGRIFEIPQIGEQTADLLINKGGSLGAMGRYEEAIECFDKVLAIDPQSAHALSNKGSALRALGQIEEAIGCYDKALSIDPLAELAWDNKGNALQSIGRHEDAIRCYDHALSIHSQSMMTWNNKGNALRALGRHIDAIGCFDKALAIDPRYAEAWNNKGATFHALGRYVEAITCFDKALAINPRYANACKNKGVSLCDLGRHKDAIGCFDEALAINPRHANAWNSKGDALDAIGRHEEAIGCYSNSLVNNPQSKIVWNNKGNVLETLGRHEDAIFCYDKALELDPQFASAWSNKGGVLYALGRYEYAIVCCDKGLEINPHFANAWNTKGNVLRGLGQHEEAIGCYVKALSLDPQDAAAWHNKALSEETSGHKREAINSYRKFIELAPSQYAQQIAHDQQRIREIESNGM